MVVEIGFDTGVGDICFASLFCAGVDRVVFFTLAVYFYCSSCFYLCFLAVGVTGKLYVPVPSPYFCEHLQNRISFVGTAETFSLLQNCAFA